jgi:uncharacterized membrane protein
MRLLRHLFAPSARRMFPADCLQRIGEAIARDEARHAGELVFAVEAGLPWSALRAGQSARERAADVFARLRLQDTADNTGVLIYLLLAERRIEILADRGLDGRISAEQWRGVCQAIEERMRAGDPEAAVLAGVAFAGDLLAAHVPRGAADPNPNERPDAPQLLD